MKYPQSLKRLILANTLHSAEMWQIGNNENSNEIIGTQYPEVRLRLDSLRSRGILSCDSTYQAIQAEVPMALLYFYNPLNEKKMSLELNLEVYRQIAGPDADVILGGEVASLDFRAKLSTVNVPTLILSGRFDRVSTPRYAIQFKRFMPRARFVMFEQSGHLPFIEEPQLHDAVLREFLKK